MLNLPPFPIPESVTQARAIQERMRARLRLEKLAAPPRLIAGVDVGYSPAENLAHASIVAVELESLKPVASARASVPVQFPYIPGLLSFREIPAILAALKKLNRPPDALMVDGQGIAHPRRMGIAAHLGVLLDLPSLGVAKSRLTGKFTEPGPRKGDMSALIDNGERIGMVLRSRDNTQPLFISPGHRMDVDSAVSLTLRCLTRYRLPEPTRLADKFSKSAYAGVDDIFAL